MPERFGQILITVPDAPGWAAVPYLVRYNERKPGAPVHQPRERILPGSVELCLTLAGTGSLVVDGVEQRLHRGRVVLMRPGRDAAVLMGASQSPPWRSLRLCLHGGWADSAAEDLITAHGHALATDPGRSVWQELIAAIPGGFGHARIWTLEQALTVSARAFAALGPSTHAAAPADPLVSAALQLMRGIDTLGSLTDIASRLHVSREHLSRRLSAAGYEPARHFRQVRLERAVTLLANRHLSIAEIMRRCGWRSQAAFARAVSAATGRTPRAHRADRPEG